MWCGSQRSPSQGQRQDRLKPQLQKGWRPLQPSPTSSLIQLQRDTAHPGLLIQDAALWEGRTTHGNVAVRVHLQHRGPTNLNCHPLGTIICWGMFVIAASLNRIVYNSNMKRYQHGTCILFVYYVCMVQVCVNTCSCMCIYSECTNTCVHLCMEAIGQH